MNLVDALRHTLEDDEAEHSPDEQERSVSIVDSAAASCNMGAPNSRECETPIAAPTSTARTANNSQAHAHFCPAPDYSFPRPGSVKHLAKLRDLDDSSFDISGGTPDLSLTFTPVRKLGQDAVGWTGNEDTQGVDTPDTGPYTPPSFATKDARNLCASAGVRSVQYIPTRDDDFPLIHWATGWSSQSPLADSQTTQLETKDRPVVRLDNVSAILQRVNLCPSVMTAMSSCTLPVLFPTDPLGRDCR
jgi:hypothetical protein